jgi:phosphoglycolate phosphatase-like HAD superfamily hydrolase
MSEETLLDWARSRPKPRAIICDIDDTLCTGFDCPLLAAVKTLATLDRSIAVHYVTARPEGSRAGTEQFLTDHRLPGWRNLHFCPSWKSTREHKWEAMARLAREYQVVVSVGDHDEDEAASVAAGIPFVRVTDETVEQAWAEVARRVAAIATLESPEVSH